MRTHLHAGLDEISTIRIVRGEGTQNFVVVNFQTKGSNQQVLERLTSLETKTLLKTVTGIDLEFTREKPADLPWLTYLNDMKWTCTFVETQKNVTTYVCTFSLNGKQFFKSEKKS